MTDEKEVFVQICRPNPDDRLYVEMSVFEMSGDGTKTPVAKTRGTSFMEEPELLGYALIDAVKRHWRIRGVMFGDQFVMPEFVMKKFSGELWEEVKVDGCL